MASKSLDEAAARESIASKKKSTMMARECIRGSSIVMELEGLKLEGCGRVTE